METEEEKEGEGEGEEEEELTVLGPPSSEYWALRESSDDNICGYISKQKQMGEKRKKKNEVGI